MSWEYRVCSESVSIAGTLLERMGYELDSDEEYTYSIREVHYWEGDESKIYLISNEDVSPFGNSFDELQSCLELMDKALTKPVIDIDELVFYDPPEDERESIEFNPGDTSFPDDFEDGPI